MIVRPREFRVAPGAFVFTRKKQMRTSPRKRFFRRCALATASRLEGPFASGAEQRAVGQALGQLSESQREVVVLHAYEGMTFAEIAHVLGSTGIAVRVRAHRGLSSIARAAPADRGGAMSNRRTRALDALGDAKALAALRSTCVAVSPSSPPACRSVLRREAPLLLFVVHLERAAVAVGERREQILEVADLGADTDPCGVGVARVQDRG